ncbi:MAG: hypothetical protein JXA57_11750 [Armatimonadetes bacterium]|nr:hypothetical protein [Armatimonadota bacterium]
MILPEKVDSAEEAFALSKPVCEAFHTHGLAALRELKDRFEELLEWELQITLNKGQEDPAHHIHRLESNAWNQIGTYLINTARLFGVAQILYKYVRQREDAFEEEHGIRLHKGYSYHNLGLCQMELGNWAEGVRNIRRAVQEDIDSGVPEEKSHAHRVTWHAIVKLRLRKMGAEVRAFGNSCNLAVSKDLLVQVFEQKPIEQGLQAAYAIVTSELPESPTDFARSLRFNALRDSCHILEVFLRDLGHIGNGLANCLDAAYGGQGISWWSPFCVQRGNGLTGAANDQEAVGNWSYIHAYGAMQHDDLLVRAHLVSSLMRNWTHHQFSTSAPLLNDPVYPKLLRYVWLCVAYAQMSLT